MIINRVYQRMHRLRQKYGFVDFLPPGLSLLQYEATSGKKGQRLGKRDLHFDAAVDVETSLVGIYYRKAINIKPDTGKGLLGNHRGYVKDYRGTGREFIMPQELPLDYATSFTIPDPSQQTTLLFTNNVPENGLSHGVTEIQPSDLNQKIQREISRYILLIFGDRDNLRTNYAHNPKRATPDYLDTQGDYYRSYLKDYLERNRNPYMRTSSNSLD